MENRYLVGLTFGNKMFVNHGLYLRTALEEVGFIDEDNYRFYHADGDLSLRMSEKGYACIDSPNSFIEHCRHANYHVRKSNINSRDWERYQARWEYLGTPSFAWKEIEYTDPNKIADKYWRTQKIKIDLFLFLRHCKRMLLNRFSSKSNSPSKTDAN